MKTNFHKGPSGKDSNSRLMADFIVIVSKIFCAVILYKATNVTEAATAISIVVGSMDLPALVFLFGQKTTEKKHDNQLIPPTS